MAETKSAASDKLRILMLGPITEEYRGNVDKLIAKLNDLRSTEIVAHLQYKHHAYMAVSMLLPGVKVEFEEHAKAESKHADKLGQRIQQLGGVPIFRPEDIAQHAETQRIKAQEAPTLEGMIQENLEIEQLQVRTYTALIREIGNDDPTTRRILEDILMETETHAAELRDLLTRRAAMDR